MPISPVVIFTYNRLNNTRSIVDSLKKNKLSSDTDLIIFSDGPKNDNDLIKVKAVRGFISNITGFRSIKVVTSVYNQGLAKSIISGVDKILEKHDSVIVLEDDLVVSNNFLNFMNSSLDFYSQNEKVFSISGFTLPIKFSTKYAFDVYFSYRASSWGWAIWKDRWTNIDWEIVDYEKFRKDNKLRRRFNRGGSDLCRMLHKQMTGKIDSWAIRFCYNQFKKEQLTVYPTSSKVINIGFNEFATHTKKNIYNMLLDKEMKLNFIFEDNAGVKPEINKQFRSYFSFYFKVRSRLLGNYEII